MNDESANPATPETAGGQPAAGCYDAWLLEVKCIAQNRLGWSDKALASFPEWDGLREAFDDGMTPGDYWCEEYSAAI